jgi:subtilase family serine protease
MRALMLLSLLVLPVGLAVADPVTRDGVLVTVHSGGPRELELLVDQLELVPRRRGADSGPVRLIAGTTLVRIVAGRATIRVTGVTSTSGLIAVARALRTANAGATVRLLFDDPDTRHRPMRRVLTDRIAVTGRNGTVTFRRLTDSLDAFEAAARATAEPDVVAAAPVAAPPRLEEKFQRKLSTPPRHDKPHEAQDFFALRRRPRGASAVPVERYAMARRHMQRMPLHATANGGRLFPPASALGMTLDAAAAVLGSWTPLGPGNVGGRTRALVVDRSNPDTLYAGGVAGGVWKSTDAGGSWIPLSDLQPNLAVSTLAMADSATIYAGTGEGFFNGDALRGAGIFKSTDGGASWSHLSGTKTDDFFFVNKIAVSPLDTSVVYAATRTGLFKSIDAGNTWMQVITAATSGDGCTDVAIAGNGGEQAIVACGTLNASNVTSEGRVYRAVDGGPFAVVLSEPGMERTSVAIAPSNGHIVYAVSSNGIVGDRFFEGLFKVYRSIDGGQTWTTRRVYTAAGNDGGTGRFLFSNSAFARGCFGNAVFSQGWYDNVIAVDPTDADRVWVGGIDLFRSDDAGVNWGQASYWYADVAGSSYAHADHHAIVFHPHYDGITNQTMFVGNDGGIFGTRNARARTSTDACAPPDHPSFVGWTALNNGYAVTQFYHGLPLGGPDGGTMYLGGTQDNGTVIGSDATGAGVWATLAGGDGGYVAVNPDNVNVFYVENTNLSLQKSVDGGLTFAPATNGITESEANFLFIAPFTMAPSNPRQLWIGGVRLWRTTNGAGSWSAGSAPTSSMGCGTALNPAQISAIAVAAGPGDRVLAGTSAGCVFNTVNALETTGSTRWTRGAGLPDGFVSSVAFHPDDVNTAYATYSTFGVPHVWKSTDGGATWTNIDGAGATAIPDVPVNAIAVDPNSPTRLYVGSDVGVFSSMDGGQTWAVENTGFANVVTEHLATGYIGGAPYLFAFTHGRGAWRTALVPTPADLVLDPAPRTTPRSVLPGGTVTVDHTVRNAGQAPGGASVVGFALVPASGPDIPLEVTRTVGVLGGSVSSRAATPVVIPRATAPGLYRIRVVADVSGIVEESDESNNTAVTTVVTVTRPDLAVASVTFTPPASRPGGTVTVTHAIRNVSAAPANAPPSVSAIYLATNQSFDSVVAQLASVSVPSIDAGATSGPLTRRVTLPDALPPGRYVILVRADEGGTLVEAATTNNVATASAPLIVGPDLTVRGARAAARVVPGGPVRVSYELRNGGGQAAGTFAVGFVLTPLSGAADVTLAQRQQVATLGPGASASLASHLLVPDAVPPATYRIRVVADAESLVSEADETNNTLLTAGTITVVQPDLAVASVTFTPAATLPGGDVTITHIVRNLSPSPATAPPTLSHLYLSRNESIAAADADLGRLPVPAIAARSRVSTTRMLRIPDGTPPGLYRVLAWANDGVAMVEADGSNNLGVSHARLRIGPDVTVVTASTVSRAIPGTSISLRHTLRNLGAVSAGPFDVTFALVPVNPPGADIPLGVFRTGITLGPRGAGAAVSTRLAIPPSVPAGQYAVRVIADAGNIVAEADESNNSRTTRTIRIAPPDLSILRLDVPAIGVAGRTLRIRNTVKNNAMAPGAARAFQVGLYLTSIEPIDPATATLLASRAVPSLAPGATSTATTTVRLPTTTGAHYLGAVADRTGAIVESVEGNNGSARAIAIVPEMARTTTAAASLTRSNCTAPENDETSMLHGTLVITNQAGTSWSGSIRLGTEGPTRITVSGSVTILGQVSGPFTIVDGTGSRGSGTFTGTVTSAADGSGTFSIDLDGSLTAGRRCTIAASVSSP